MKKPATAYAWPIDLDKYDRSVEISNEELTFLGELVKHKWRGQHRRPHWFVPLSRILQPLQDAAEALKLPCGRITGGLGFIVAETAKRRRTIWGWTHEDWCDILRGKVCDFESNGLGKEFRTGAMAIG